MNDQLVIPMPLQTTPVNSESMTFNTQQSRDGYIREQRAYGYEIFLSYQGTNSHGLELYSVTRRKL